MQADHLRMQAGRHRTRLGDFSHATNNPTRGSSTARSSRHPDLVNLAPVVVQPRRDIEADQRYRRCSSAFLRGPIPALAAAAGQEKGLVLVL